jgi:hypothetical protein
MKLHFRADVQAPLLIVTIGIGIGDDDEDNWRKKESLRRTAR